MAKKQEKENMLPVLKTHIKENTPARLYFFYGEEMFLLQHYLEQLRKILIDELTESFNYHKLTTETFDIRSFADAVENLPMMAERTMVLVDDIDIFKMADSDREKMVEILSDIPEYCTVVFLYETVEWKPDKRFAKLYNTVRDYGIEVEFAKQSQRDLIAWITRHFAANKKTITPDLCAYLIDITGGTMTALAGEISKISAFSGADQIVKSDIDAVTEPVLDAVVFQMLDALGQGNSGQAMVKLQQLMKMQEEPLSVLGSIGGHYRRLSTAKILLDNGKTANDLMRLHRISSDYVAKKNMAAARSCSAAYLARVSELVMETDRNIKTSVDDPVRLLELLVLQLAQEARNDKNP
ncbi:MAG: DNA polymerase III subunit delta [Oscillospiraceae bacterium]|nr:DNA polymerase III subunit delta [Oscillospiraceae bacterium]